jgi:predicted O-methyltransferase YrrM
MRAYVAAGLVAGLLVGVAGWLLGSRAALAIGAGLAVAGGVVFVQWLRLRQRWIGTELDRVGREVAGLRHLVEDRLGAQDRGLRDQLDSLREHVTDKSKRIRLAERQTFAQTQALHNLYAMLSVRHQMPVLRESWAVSPDLMLLVVSLLQERRPATIVELGSGASTIWMALALDQFGLGSRLISVDHDAGFGEQTRERLAAYGLEKRVELRHAPLVDLELAGQTLPWYHREALADLESCDLLLVDGPPGSVGPQARYPALPVLADRMAPGSCVLVDDYNRDGEREMVARWVADLPSWTVRELPLEKGAALLTRA